MYLVQYQRNSLAKLVFVYTEEHLTRDSEVIHFWSKRKFGLENWRIVKKIMTLSSLLKCRKYLLYIVFLGFKSACFFCPFSYKRWADVASNPAFYQQEIVWRHKELQANVNSLQQQVSSAEQDQERLVRQRQQEILSKYRKNGHINGVSYIKILL